MSRISAARRPAFKRPAALIPLEFLEVLVVFEAGIVIFPPGPGAAASSKESTAVVDCGASRLLAASEVRAGQSLGINLCARRAAGSDEDHWRIIERRRAA